jgi:uncharacterized membrane protein SpoIIM required for sporulation
MEILVYTICAIIGFFVGWYYVKYQKEESSNRTLQLKYLQYQMKNAKSRSDVMKLQTEVNHMINEYASLSRRQEKILDSILETMKNKIKEL